MANKLIETVREMEYCLDIGHKSVLDIDLDYVESLESDYETLLDENEVELIDELNFSHGEL